MKRVELHAHTKMSRLDGIADIKDLIRQATDWGHKAIAITDHGVVKAFPEVHLEAKRAAKEGRPIKIIYGLECYLVNDDGCENLAEFDYKQATTYHCTVLVKNMTGLKNLYRLVTESHMKYFYEQPRIPKSLLQQYREGLLIGSACAAGEIYQAILLQKPELAQLASFYDYFEIQADNALENPNLEIVALAESQGKLCVATGDVHFTELQDAVFRQAMLQGQGYYNAEDEMTAWYFKDTDEMLADFQYLGEEKAYEVVVKNTNRIADMIADIVPVPEGYFPPVIEHAEEDLRAISVAKAKSIYGDSLPQTVAERLEKELGTIEKYGFAVFYMLAQKLVEKSHSDGYPVGSRGAVASSLVAYMAGITEVNPLPAHYICPQCKHTEFPTDGVYACGFDMPKRACPVCGREMQKDGYDIPFETFSGFDGDKVPDIDINVSGDYQQDAKEYMETLFGEARTFYAGTTATVTARTAYGYAGAYFEEKGEEISLEQLLAFRKALCGVLRWDGIHPGGVMVVPENKDVYDFTPLQYCGNNPNTKQITSHFDYHFLHDAILKMDILGHDDPTMLRMLQELTGVNPTTIPIGEEKTMELFRSAQTIAIPEFGTAFVRNMLQKTKPESFSDLIRISGLAHGTDVWLDNGEELLADGTCKLSELIACRDDIMLYLVRKGMERKSAYRIMEHVRRGKGLRPEYVEMMREIGVPQWYIESCQKIKYLFPKAHAAAYVMMAFRIAWFKVYYPAEFYATYFTVRLDGFGTGICTMAPDEVTRKIAELKAKGDNTTKEDRELLKISEVVHEIHDRGISFLPFDPEKSDDKKLLAEDGNLRLPLIKMGLSCLV